MCQKNKKKEKIRKLKKHINIKKKGQLKKDLIKENYLKKRN